MAESSAVPLQTSQAVSSAYDVEAGNDAPANKQNGVPCYKNIKYLTIVAVLPCVVLLFLIGVIEFLILRRSIESSTVAPSTTRCQTASPPTGTATTPTSTENSSTTESPSTMTHPSLEQATLSGKIVSASGPIRGIKQDMSKEE
ncbi:hypothetical protein Ddc_10175 [Ditylenchus destructor]|nr:hypothetical protein Ddc_10175 [Ditylenchus destructor]